MARHASMNTYILIYDTVSSRVHIEILHRSLRSTCTHAHYHFRRLKTDDSFSSRSSTSTTFDRMRHGMRREKKDEKEMNSVFGVWWMLLTFLRLSLSHIFATQRAQQTMQSSIVYTDV